MHELIEEHQHVLQSVFVSASSDFVLWSGTCTSWLQKCRSSWEKNVLIFNQSARVIYRSEEEEVQTSCASECILSRAEDD